MADLNEGKWTVETKQIHEVPAGTYYIGDPLYVLDEELCEEAFGEMEAYISGLYTKKDSTDFFFLARTGCGDGEYEGSDGSIFGVDSALIGIVPLSLCSEDTKGGHVYIFTSPVTCDFRKKGIFFFASDTEALLIDTSYDEYQ